MPIIPSLSPLIFPRTAHLDWSELFFQLRNCRLAPGTLLSKHSYPEDQKQLGSVAQASSMWDQQVYWCHVPTAEHRHSPWIYSGWYHSKIVCHSRAQSMAQCTKFVWEGFGSGGATGWFLWKAAWSFPHVQQSQHEPAPRQPCCWLRLSPSVMVVAHLGEDTKEGDRKSVV